MSILTAFWDRLVEERAAHIRLTRPPYLLNGDPWKRSPLRVTRTSVTLEVSAAVYDEVRSELEAAGYGHCFTEAGEIDMHGIALVREVADVDSSKPQGVSRGEEVPRVGLLARSGEGR